MKDLYHVSENGNIDIFEPRPPPSIVNGHTDPCVWAINEKHLVNYLVPRDCPRVTCYATPDSTSEDQVKVFGEVTDRHLIAIESAWFKRCLESELWVYQLDPQGFEALDPGAGYSISRMTVHPIGKQCISNGLNELARRNNEIRVLPNLWALRDQILASTLQFSFIRMRNAQPRFDSC